MQLQFNCKRVLNLLQIFHANFQKLSTSSVSNKIVGIHFEVHSYYLGVRNRCSKWVSDGIWTLMYSTICTLVCSSY